MDELKSLSFADLAALGDYCRECVSDFEADFVNLQNLKKRESKAEEALLADINAFRGLEEMVGEEMMSRASDLIEACKSHKT